MNNRLSIVGFILLAAIPLGCGSKGETAVEATTKVPKPVPIRDAPITLRAVERTVEVVGSLKGWDEVTIGAKRAGRIAKVRHDMGDRVKPGEPLVQLETIDTDLAIEQAQKRLDADLAKLGLKDFPRGAFDLSNIPSVVQSRLALDRARLNLTRERNLMTKGAGTTQDFQNADNDEKAGTATLENTTLTAQSTLASAMASKVALDVAKQSKVDLTILAPVPSIRPDGFKKEFVYAITKRTVSEGQMVKEGDPLYDLTIENPLRLWANVPERYSESVALGQEVRIHVASAPKQVFKGTVRKINPSVDPVSRTFQVEASVPNDEGRLRPGGFAKVSIVTKRNDRTLTVPREAIDSFGGIPKVYLLTDNKVRAVTVESGVEGEGWVEAIGDLPSEGRVATEGFRQLANDTMVTIKEPLTTPSPTSSSDKAAGETSKVKTKSKAAEF